MPGSPVETKLLAPRARERAVARPRLTDLLHRGLKGRLTLVSSPAGFGKTTLLAASFPGGRVAAAWVSLDERDRDASSFWTYILLAVNRATPGTASAALAQLESGHESIDAVLTTLLNELSVLPGDLIVVLDDYHLAEGPDISPGIRFLVERLPP